MRIAFLTELFPPSVGGQEVRFAELADALAMRGHTVQVFCIKHDAGLPTREQIGPGVEVFRYPTVDGYTMGRGGLLPRSLQGVLRFALSTRRQLQQVRFDAVFLNEFPMLHVMSLPRHDRKRAVIDWCEIRDTPLYRLLQNLLPRMVRANTAVSEEIRSYIIPRSAGPVLMLPSGIRLERYWAADSAARAGILYLGRIEEHKNVPLVVQAFDALCRRGSCETLSIAGAGPAMGDVESAVQASPFKDRITLAGLVTEDEKLRLLAHARILLLPSRREGFPRVVAEAIASSLPTVTTRSPGNGTVGIVERFDCGVCADPDAEALATAMATILADWDMFSQRAGAGASELDWSAVVTAFEQLLYQVISPNGVADA